MSFTMYGTDEVFSALRRQISDCFQSVEDAAGKYARLLKHCEKQRDELAGLKDPERKERTDRMKWALSREEEQAMEERTRTEHDGVGSSKVRAGSSITDELRDWFKDRLFMGNGYAEITAIADRIDEQHAGEVGAAERNGYVEAMDKVDSEYIKLPKDADGVPWHIGDKVDGMVGEITYLSLGYIGWTFRIGDAYTFECERYRHYREPTVEDVLRECIANVCRSNAELREQGCPPLTMEDIDEELYVKRPVDADEEPILRGDRMVDRDGYRFTADWFEFFGDEEWSVHDTEDNSFEPSECRHRQVAPWQAVLDHAKRKAGEAE